MRRPSASMKNRPEKAAEGGSSAGGLPGCASRRAKLRRWWRPVRSESPPHDPRKGQRVERVLIWRLPVRTPPSARPYSHEAEREATIAGTSPAFATSSQGRGRRLIVEEALQAPDFPDLGHWIEQQPPWSDLPIVLLTQRERRAERNRRASAQRPRSATSASWNGRSTHDPGQYHRRRPARRRASTKPATASRHPAPPGPAGAAGAGSALRNWRPPTASSPTRSPNASGIESVLRPGPAASKRSGSSPRVAHDFKQPADGRARQHPPDQKATFDR